MKAKFVCLVLLLETLSFLGLFYLLRQPGMPAAIGLALVFALPIVFGVHVAEEFISPGGHDVWQRAYRPQFAAAMTSDYFVKINAIPMVLSLLLAFGVLNYAGGYGFAGMRAWFVFLGTLAFNAVFHIQGTLRTKQYSPGLVTALALYLPLTVVSFQYFVRAGVVDPISPVICIAIGSQLQRVLDAIKAHTPPHVVKHP